MANGIEVTELARSEYFQILQLDRTVSRGRITSKLISDNCLFETKAKR